jgi:4-carboxymuconolactone decarboxylase
MMSVSERTEQAAAVAREIFGFVPPTDRHEWEPESARELRETMFTQAFCETWTRTSLDNRTRELLTIAMMAAVGSLDEMKGHITGALRLGVTPDELVDVFAHVSAYMGTARAVPAWEVASRVMKKLAERERA